VSWPKLADAAEYSACGRGNAVGDVGLTSIIISIFRAMHMEWCMCRAAKNK